MAIDPSLINTLRVGELVPAALSLTDNIPHEIGTDLRRCTIADLVAFLTPLVGAMPYEVRTFHVNSAYITDNFDSTGLGINLMTGYAICNGNNGTLNKDGRVGIAYGTTTNVIGQFGGSKDAVLISHNHTTPLGIVAGTHISGSGSFDVGTNVSTSTAASSIGETGAGKNMQPYVVELQVMRLP